MAIEAEPDSVGVRELRQNLSVYLRRVEAGETLRVTDRGQPVAILAPVPPPRTRLQQMIADGKVRMATESFDDLPAPLPAGPGMSISEALQEQRADRL